jgi:hypothetical protein
MPVAAASSNDSLGWSLTAFEMLARPIDRRNPSFASVRVRGVFLLRFAGFFGGFVVSALPSQFLVDAIEAENGGGKGD